MALDKCLLFSIQVFNRYPPLILRKVLFCYEMKDTMHYFLLALCQITFPFLLSYTEDQHRLLVLRSWFNIEVGSQPCLNLLRGDRVLIPVPSDC